MNREKRLEAIRKVREDYEKRSGKKLEYNAKLGSEWKH